MMLPQDSRLAAIAVAGLFLLGVQADENASCYLPGGEFAPGFYPCIAFDVAYSACCPAGWSCFSNALCIATTPSPTYPNLTYGVPRRAACTAPKWANNVCGDFCLDPDNKAGKMIYCGRDRFCCENDFNTGKCSCASNGNATTIRPGQFQTIVHVSDATFTGTPSISIAMTSPSIRSTSGGTPTTGGASSDAGGPTGTVEATQETSSDDNNERKLIIGLAVGLGGGLILLVLGALGFLWWRKRKQTQEHHVTDPIEPKPASTPSVATPTPAPPVEAYIDDDLREDDPHGPRYRNDWGTPRRVDI